MRDEIVSKIRNAGITGMGGAGFPTHVKAMRDAEIVIANGAECEPLTEVDNTLMKESPREIVLGLKKMMEATNAPRGAVALKEKHSNAVAAFEPVIAEFPDIHMHLMEDYYPAGDEYNVVFEVTGKIVPEGKIPPDIGVIVCNVATLSNIHKAMDDKPLIKRIVTVSGAVKNPKSMWLPIGTTIERAIELAGGSTERYYRVIHGGPMMGKVIDDLTAGTTKGTTSILVLPDNHTLIYKKTRTEMHNLNIARSTCDQCVLCTVACPRNLLGHELYPHETVRAVISPNTLGHPNITSGYQCCECGICGLYACPMGIFPNALYTKIRKELRDNKVPNPHKKAPVEPHEFRDYRKIPTNRLASRLDLDDYTEIPISYDDGDQKVRQVRLCLSAHIGAPSEPVVQLGQRVIAGELVAEIPEGALGARVHATIEGIVKEIDGEIIIERG